MTRHIKVVALIILAVGLFHGARRLYSSHMLFSESLHGNQGATRDQGLIKGAGWHAPVPTQNVVDELVLERKTRKHMETEHVDLQMELHKMKDELAHLTEQFAQQQAVKDKDHRREMKTLQNQLNEYQISERTQEL
eukprot:CAMPEP_0198217228 /NCGR_PEP_ID=MMETSP1445-20131203/62335_1 /TAXON_ID=36898 /ORGANISM="Pyramimonas sp., Strain CCMP2087" /LENGTH=135 /DNA_ID=CAMNT_0043893813 /DNA_START=318 /DNA_END=722 /DNA_ORIENTATION=-